MNSLSRRGLLLGVGSGLAASVVGKPASATVMRSVSLSALTQSSRGIVIVTPLSAESRYEELGRRRRIVTDTRVRIEERVGKAEGFDSELMVRTLGGSVGNVGERVHGQVQWSLGAASVVFLLQGPDGLCYVNGMAQGHYPVLDVRERTLTRSPDLPEIMDFESSAVKQLVGTPLGRATTLIRAALVP